MIKQILAALALVGVAGAATPSFALRIGPGQFGSPDILSVGSSATKVGGVPTGTFTAATFTGTYTESVFRDPSNPLPGCTGNCLDYVLNVSNNATSKDGIARITVGSFAGFVTDVGFEAVPGVAVAPTLVTRSPDTGDVVGWTFGTGALRPKTSSVPLILMTNATGLTTGLVSAQDSSTDTESGFGATTPVPEPATLALLGAGLVGLGLMRRRRD